MNRLEQITEWRDALTNIRDEIRKSIGTPVDAGFPLLELERCVDAAQTEAGHLLAGYAASKTNAEWYESDA